MSSISYAITTHNEGASIQTLINMIEGYMDTSDEIIIVDDYSTDKKTTHILSRYDFVTKRRFDKNYSDHKNFLNSLCTRDYIFQIDGDELPSPHLLNFIKSLLKNRDDIDLYWIPRENKLHNIDMEYIKKWKWAVDQLGRINYPDYQGRVYRNKPHIKWSREVHEIITGHKTQLILPKNSNVDILHHRDMEHQIRSNKFYHENFK